MSDRLKLLIIDDDRGDQELMKIAIKDSGFGAELDTACNGEEGLVKAGALKPEIIVLDSFMPGIDGFEVCRRIKAMNGPSKIIICTGAVDAAVISKAKAAGADECCLKTSDYTALTHVIRNLVKFKENSGDTSKNGGR